MMGRVEEARRLPAPGALPSWSRRGRSKCCSKGSARLRGYTEYEETEACVFWTAC